MHSAGRAATGLSKSVTSLGGPLEMINWPRLVGVNTESVLKNVQVCCEVS
jgi:hypothetical protein